LLVVLSGLGGDTVLLDFTASWCGPCRQVAPLVEQLAAAGYPVRQVDIDREPELARRFQVRQIPCFVMLIDGREVDREVGAASRSRLMQMLAKARQAPGPVAQSAPRPRAGRAAPASRPMPVTPAAQPLAEREPADPFRRHYEERLLAASVRIKVKDRDGHAYGSGTIIDAADDEALILTCGHIFRDSNGQGPITVDLFGPGAPQQLEGRLLAFDLKRDLGLLVIRPGVTVTPAPVARPECRVGRQDAVASVGCDHGRDATVLHSRITNVNKYLGEPNLQVAGQPVVGRSGGGLFNAEGQVIGVCNAADPEDNEGIFAALASIHAALDSCQLGHIYKSRPADELIAVAPPPRMPAAMPRRSSEGTDGVAAPEASSVSLSEAERRVLAALRSSQGVIAVVKSSADPASPPSVIVLEDAPPALLQQIAAWERESRPSQVLTSGRRGEGDPLARRPTQLPAGRPPDQPVRGNWAPQWKRPAE
jgi:thiol-disulfide isomerase/thioredoxin